MFEEDFERCFICQAPSKGLYCSTECRQQDKGTASPSTKAANGPVRLTAQLPVSLSPMVRPVHHIAPSPAFGPRRRGNSSSSSSVSDSPIQSPHTNPSASDSPQKESFNLPPPAYPNGMYGINIGSVPAKIPHGFSSRVPSTAPGSGAATPGSASTAYAMGTSIDTLRFGRKSSVTNSVTSPLALIPRCGCGRPIGHRARSRERSAVNEVENGISCLSLGPSVTTEDSLLVGNALRIVSDSGYRGARTPSTATYPLPEERSISNVLGSSLLARSRSDPMPPSPRDRNMDTVRPRLGAGIHPRPTVDMALRTPPPMATAPLPSVAPSHPRSRSALPHSEQQGEADRRGRSRERVARAPQLTTPEQENAKLPFHEEREVAPSRSGRSRNRDADARQYREADSRRSRSRHDTLGFEQLSEAPAHRGRVPRVGA